MSDDNDKVLDTVIRGLEEARNVSQSLQAEIHSNVVTVTSIRKEVDGLSQDTSWLIRNVRDEGGDRSVMARLLILENDTKSFNQWLAEQKKKEESKTGHLESLANEDHKGKWQLRIALATGCLGFIATIITAILGFYFKK